MEGNAMGHCVASYAGNCKSAVKISVWSMRVAEGDLAPKRVMTVSVHNNSRRINQARGKHNALPNGKAPNGHKRKFSRRVLPKLPETVPAHFEAVAGSGGLNISPKARRRH